MFSGQIRRWRRKDKGNTKQDGVVGDVFSKREQHQVQDHRHGETAAAIQQQEGKLDQVFAESSFIPDVVTVSQQHAGQEVYLKDWIRSSAAAAIKFHHRPRIWPNLQDWPLSGGIDISFAAAFACMIMLLLCSCIYAIVISKPEV